ncbi:MAG TPA: UDP-N-acetylmuramoyl-L-alanine--D-glutamate ligase, partial [Bacillota bacterium]|nr:UDP-N-acetylmuramoyl-L-alanine--D-glutamate ligase [Bacillota bacterium]
MQIKGKKVLVIGAAVTGVPVVKQLSRLGADIVLNDFKKVEELKEVISEIQELPIKLVAGGHPARLAEDCDFVVISPGVPLDIPPVQRAKAMGKE